MHLLGWILFGSAIIWHFLSLNHLSKRINSLNEFVQFLFFNPAVYNNHRTKFLEFLKKHAAPSLKEQAVLSNDNRMLWAVCSRTIDAIAQELYGEITLANVAMRSDASMIEQ